MGVQHILHELFLLEHEEGLLDLLHIVELRLLEHLRRAAEVEALPLARIERPVDDLEG